MGSDISSSRTLHARSDAPTPNAPSNRLRGRFWLACAVTVPANLVWCVWTLSVNPVGPYFDECPLLANVVVFLLLMAGLNALLRRFRPSWAYSQTELLLLYTVLAISTAVGGSSYAQALGITIAYPYWFGQLGLPGQPNLAAIYDWRAFLSYLPSWLVVSDREALKGFWEGNTTVYQWSVLHAWWVPLLSWTGFIVVFFFLTMCLNVLLRKHWVQHERLTFPIVWLPMEMTRPSAALFRSRLMWVGFVPAFASQLINGLAYFYPSIPTISTKFYILQSLFPDPPWSAMNNFTVAFHPLMIGLGYLLPQDLLFSSWFFHLFWQAERVLAAAVGFTPEQQQSGFPHIIDQAFGGSVALGLLALWGARHQLRGSWHRAIGRRSPSAADDLGEALSARSAFVGLALSLGAVLAFMVASGMSVVTAVCVVALLLVVLLAMTRIRAESGGPLLDMTYYLGPALSLTKVAGTRAFSSRELTSMSLHQWYVEFGFNQPMPYGMEALKMAEESRRAQRQFFVAAVIAAIIGMVGIIFVEMNYAYSWGEAAKFSKTTWGQTGTWNRLNTWITQPTGGNPGAVIGMLAGAGITVFLAIMRTRYMGWQFHPVPFVVTAGLGVYVGFFWLPFFIAWLAKTLIVRHWGRKGFQTSLPFFYGLIMGEMAGGMLWPLYGMLTQRSTYSFFGW